jgi:two-component system sensor histidine kinase KdpD
MDDLVIQAVDEMGDGGARVEISLSDDSAAVQVDAHQIQRVLVNLIENALKYSSDPVRLQVSSTPTEVLVRVVDQGAGVRANELDRIFEPFQRGSLDHGRGAGLGLAIARGFAEANHGRVWAESRPGQGATFVLALPTVRTAVHA